MRPSLQQARTGIVLLVVMGVLTVGWWQANHLKQTTGDAGSKAGTGLTLYRGEAGLSLPALRGRTVDGTTLSLGDLRGRVLVVNVWGSWCAPCRAEAPELATISAETAARGVRFVGIDVRDNRPAARAFTRKYAITYPSFDDQNGIVLAQFTGIIPVSAVPSTLVVDRNGVIRARVVGQVDGTTLRGLIEDVDRLR